MNVYQKVLLELYDATGGRETKAVYLKDLVKDMGFLPSYNDIFSQMSTDGWITETRRTDEVNITPWGIRAAKKLRAGDVVDSRDVERAAKHLQSAIRDASVMCEELMADTTGENLDAIENQLATIESKIKTLRKII